jgi:spermidine/putrescine transport system permease protein
VPEAAGSGTRGAWFPRWFWPSFSAPATAWLILFFVLPFYVILGIAFGQLDQIFLTPIPVYNPLRWDTAAFVDVVRQFGTAGSIYQSALWHTLIFVGISTRTATLSDSRS